MGINSNINISGSAVVEDCLAQKAGGAIHVNESSILTISQKVVIAGHSAGEHGGAVCAVGGDTTVNISDSSRFEEVGGASFECHAHARGLPMCLDVFLWSTCCESSAYVCKPLRLDILRRLKAEACKCG